MHKSFWTNSSYRNSNADLNNTAALASSFRLVKTYYLCVDRILFYHITGLGVGVKEGAKLGLG